MSQQAWIFAALLIGFIVYVTIRGRLSSYLALFHAKAQATSAPLSPTNPGTPFAPYEPTLNTLGSFENLAPVSSTVQY